MRGNNIADGSLTCAPSATHVCALSRVHPAQPQPPSLHNDAKVATECKRKPLASRLATPTSHTWRHHSHIRKTRCYGSTRNLRSHCSATTHQLTQVRRQDTPVAKLVDNLAEHLELPALCIAAIATRLQCTNANTMGIHKMYTRHKLHIQRSAIAIAKQQAQNSNLRSATTMLKLVTNRG